MAFLERALEHHGRAGTGQQQGHDGEQDGSGSTGERQLIDGLHVLHGLVGGVDQAPRIRGPSRAETASWSLLK